MQRHVAVGYIVAQNEEPHRYMVACGRYGAAALFGSEHLEAIHYAVRNRLATVGAVAALYDEGLFVHIRFLSQRVEFHGLGQFLELLLSISGGWFVFDDVTGRHVLKHLVGIP